MSYLTFGPHKDNDKVEIICDTCNKHSIVLYISAKRNFKKHNENHICASCSAKKSKHLKPQTTREYWTPERRKTHGEVVKSSSAYYESLKHRDLSGPKNGMYGKPAPALVKLKNSLRQKGKFGEQALAWKGGKTSLTRRVKGYLHKEHHWYFNVYKRDGFKCVKCGSKNIDAHHIKPIVTIIKELCATSTFATDSEKFLFLISHPDIVDSSLKNGITLCRACHKEEHSNWGSHIP